MSSIRKSLPAAVVRLRAVMTAGSVLAASAVVSVAAASPASAATTFSNPTAINVADANGASGAPGTGSLYPSNIVVSGQSGTISHLTVTLNNVSHPFANDLDVLLVGPNGAKFELVSDAGGSTSTTNVTPTFDDAAASALTVSGNWGAANSSVTVKPTNVDSGSPDAFPSPAPAGPYLNPDNGTFLGVNSQSLDTAFGGASPNGTWSLYVVDDTSGDTGSIAGGWSINVTSATAAATTTTVTSSTNPSTTGSAVTFTAHVVDDTSAAVTSGTVTFKDGGTTLASGVALNASGNASMSTSALGEGAHTIQAVYSGTASFATSNGTVTQVVDNPTTQTGNTFSNSGSIAINDVNVGGAGFPYPSHLTVSGLSGAVSNLTVTLKNVSHPDIDDVDAMLVGPGGQRLVFVSDAGSASSATSNATLTFDDGAAGQVAATGPWTTGTFQPTDYNSGTDTFPSPAPAGASAAAPQGAATLTSVFGGTNPNGQWSLYVADDSAGGAGNIAGGWALTVTTSSDAPTTTTVTSAQNPSVTGSAVTFTAHVTKSADASDVTLGTVTFRDGSTVIGSPVPLSGAGTASVSTSSLSEGAHTITASYNGSAGSFNLSSGTLTQQVDSPTVVAGSTYCNNGGLAIQNAAGSDLVGTASVYPSHITVAGATGNLVKLTATIKGLTHAAPDDVDVLLVSPNGTTLKLMSDSGGSTAVSNIDLTFDDAAASLLPDSTALSSGTFRPTDYESGDVFPSPAPAGPYGAPASVGSATLASFAGGSPNGTWSLYVVDDSAGLAGSITGWCLNLTMPPAANDDSYAAAQDTTLTVPAPGVLTNDTGTPAPTAVAISGGATTQGGTVTLASNGGFSYDPPAGFTGTDTFTYTATNGPGATDTATVTLLVTHKPTIVAGTVSRQQGSPAANDTIATVDDAETAAGNLTVTANPPAGISVSNITNTGGTVTADVAANCAATTGANLVPLTVTDADGQTRSDNLTVNVSANAAPSLSYGSAAVNAGAGTSADPFTGPSDNGSVPSLAVQNVPGAFTGTVSVDGPASATPGRVRISNAGPAGDYTVTVRATDNCGTTTDAALSLTVNGSPVVDAGPDQTVTLAAGADLAGSVTDDGRAPGDATSTALWSKQSGPGAVTFADPSDPATSAGFSQPGVYVLQLTGDDGQLTSSDTVQITVNTPPVIHVPADITVPESSPGAGAPVTFTVTADGTPTPSISCVEGATPVSSGDTFAAGVHTIDCTATNSVGSDSGSFTITVTQPPVITSADHTTFAVGSAGSFTVTTTPGTPSATTITETGSLPSGVTFSDNGDGTATLAGTPAVGAGGSYPVTVTASNGVLPDPTQSFTLTVTELPAITSADHTGFTVGTAGSFTATTAPGFPAATTMTEIGALPSGVTFTDNGDGTATLAGTPASGTAASYPLTITATNAAGHTDQAFTLTVGNAAQTITVTSVPPSPAVVGGTYPLAATATSGLPVAFSVDASTTASACSLSGATVSLDHAGTCVLDFDQAGDGTWAPAPQVQQSFAVTTVATTVGLTASVPHSVFGQPVTATATIGADSGAPAGTVTFSVDGTQVGAPVPVTSGTATSDTLTDAAGQPLAPGAHTVTADFTPDDATTYGASTASTDTLVDKAATTSTVSVAAHSITATVAAVAPGAGVPTGTVSFDVNGTQVGAATLASGTATLTYTVPSGRTQNVSVAYAGDTDFTGSSASTARHDPTITARVTSATPRTRYGWYRSPVTITFTCTPAGAPLTAACPAPVRRAHQGAAQTVTRTITATDGGVATVTVKFSLDSTQPTVRVAGVRNGAVYRGVAPKARCVGRDALSGIATCRITRHTSGEVTRYVAVAKDRAGNRAVTRGHYRTLRIWFASAPYRSGAFDLRRGHTYTLYVKSVRRPYYYDPAVAPLKPTRPDQPLFATTRANMWAIAVHIPSGMRRGLWHFGVRIGRTLHQFNVRIG